MVGQLFTDLRSLMLQANYEQQRKALCELIDTNICTLETLRRQFFTPKVENCYVWRKQPLDNRLHKLEEQDTALQALLEAVESTLQNHDLGIRTALSQVQQARSRVAESCCFISKLPNELLRDIILRASKHHDEMYNSARININYAPYGSFQLASVCRRWQAVAISIPSLWTDIRLMPGSHQSARREEFWQIVRTYTQNAPVNISIADNEIYADLIEERRDLWKDNSPEELADYGYVCNAIEQMRLYKLESLSAINSIEITLEYEPDIRRILDPEYQNLDCRCHTLRLTRTGDYFVAHLSDLLYHFDAEVVKCEYARELVPGEPVTGRSLTEIHLHQIERIPLDDLLANFTEILVLRCTQSILQWEATETLVHPNLEVLELEYTQSSMKCRWLDYLHCPTLTGLAAAGWANDKAFTDFIDRSPHLRSINLEQSDEQNLLRLMSHLPRVQHLNLSPDAIGLLHNWMSSGLSNAPLPLLKTVKIRNFDGEKHALLPLIRERSLAPYSSSKETSSQLASISLEVINGRNIVESTLRESGLADLINVEWEGEIMDITIRDAEK